MEEVRRTPHRRTTRNERKTRKTVSMHRIDVRSNISSSRSATDEERQFYRFDPYAQGNSRVTVSRTTPTASTTEGSRLARVSEPITVRDPHHVEDLEDDAHGEGEGEALELHSAIGETSSNAPSTEHISGSSNSVTHPEELQWLEAEGVASTGGVVQPNYPFFNPFASIHQKLQNTKPMNCTYNYPYRLPISVSMEQQGTPSQRKVPVLSPQQRWGPLDDEIEERASVGGDTVMSVADSTVSVGTAQTASVASSQPAESHSTRHSTQNSLLPRGTLHRSLRKSVTFIPYPTQSFQLPVGPAASKHLMERIFIGQLPYQVTDMQLSWLCYTFGRGVGVFFPERIVKYDESKGGKVPTGCVHAYCRPCDVEMLMSGLHKRLLIDDTGVWWAANEEEQLALVSYCKTMKHDSKSRMHNRPYDTVVIQKATSHSRGGKGTSSSSKPKKAQEPVATQDTSAQS